jgi:hypothetical protein
MRLERPSSELEYAAWFLRRAAFSGDARQIPNAAAEKLAVMRERHSGKVRSWFNDSTRWYIAELDLADLEKLVFLECDWTKGNGLVQNDGPDYRTLMRVALRAKAMNYISLACCNVKQRAYYESLERVELTLEGAHRLAICSAEPSEMSSNPSASYYLLDGVGRCLPYMILLLEQKIEPLRIEAFVAERGTW